MKGSRHGQPHCVVQVIAGGSPVRLGMLGLFIIAEYNNYQKGVTITRICELTGDHDTSYLKARTARQELDMICTNRSADDDQPEN